MKDYIMKKTSKIIDGDKVTIIEGNNPDLDDDMEPEYDLSKVVLKPKIGRAHV